MDELKVINGYIQGERFIMQGIMGHAVVAKYHAEGLKSLTRLIHDNEPFSLKIDKDKAIGVLVELNLQLIKGLLLIVNELSVPL